MSKQKPASGNAWKKVSISSDAPCGLPVIHVLEHQPGAKSSIGVRFHEAVRVGDDGADPQRKPAQLLHEGQLVETLVLDGRMHADIAEWQPRLCSQIRQQSRKLVPGKRRQLDRECGHLACLVDERRPVAARSFKDARGDPDRMVVGQGMVRCVSGGGHGLTVSRADDDQAAQGPKTGTKPGTKTSKSDLTQPDPISQKPCKTAGTQHL